jgi:hypothetical protein
MKADSRFKIPSKTFLVGEYAVLFGGESLVVTHRPFFECSRVKTIKGDESFNKKIADFHIDSPAARLMKNYGLAKDFDFVDPHLGGGGFGGSTAEVVASLKGRVELTPEKLVSEYVSLEKSDDKPAPSGADLCAQWISSVEVSKKVSKRVSKDISIEVGGGPSAGSLDRSRIFSFKKDQEGSTSKSLIQELVWPFKDVSVLVYKRPSKLKTHLHLKSIVEDKSHYKHLISLSKTVVESLKKGGSSFFTDLEDFSKEQERLSLLDPQSVVEVQSLKKMPSVLTARACGAFGADVVLVFSSNKEQLDKLNHKIVGLDFKYTAICVMDFATSGDLKSG